MNQPSVPELRTHWPCRWGEGALFAFSGVDGEADALSGFVATLGDEPFDLLWHTPRQRHLRLRIPGGAALRILTGDAMEADAAGGPVTLAFSAWHTLTGQIPPDAAIDLLGPDGGATGEAAPGLSLDRDPAGTDALALCRGPGRFALAFGRSATEAEDRAREALARCPAPPAAARLAFLAALPQLPDPGLGRLLAKCASVMKVNTLSAQGPFRQRWSTPDRVPHRDLWLWDSVFHSLGMNHFSPPLAWEFLASVLDAQCPDGRIPLQTCPDGHKNGFTQPPLLAWGVWRNYLALGDRAALARSLPALEAYLNWDCANRDTNGNGLLEWKTHPDARCRCGESGLDNSPRFDGGEPLDAVDFSTLAAHDMGCVARIAKALGDDGRAREWSRRAAELSAAIHRGLWDEADGFYYDRTLGGRLAGVRAVTGFLPLLLDDLPPARAARLVATLRDPAHFGVPFPVPSLSVSHPAWSTDMWRGATWLNMNYLVIEGLKRQGYADEARRLADTSIAHVRKYAESLGVIFEFYDAKDAVAPTDCERKGPRQRPYNIRVKADSIRDYHWSAAMTVCLLLDK
jgi:hypothetical protein